MPLNMTPKQFKKWVKKHYPNAQVEEHWMFNLGRQYKVVRVTLYQQAMWAVIVDHSTLGAEIFVKNPSAGRTWIVLRPEEAEAYAVALRQAAEIIGKVGAHWAERLAA